MISTPSRPLHERRELLLSPEPVPNSAQLVNVHPLPRRFVRRLCVLADQPLHHRELRVSAHARLLEVFDVLLPPADHVRAARVAQAREEAVELLRDGVKLGVELGGEGVRVRVADAADDGDFEGNFWGWDVSVEGVVGIQLDADDGQLSKLEVENKG